MGGVILQNVRLSELLDEAKERCQATIKDRREDIGDDELDMASSAMGYGAIKYADLKNHRTTNYKQALSSIPSPAHCCTHLFPHSLIARIRSSMLNNNILKAECPGHHDHTPGGSILQLLSSWFILKLPCHGGK